MNPATTLRFQYNYADGADNTVRPTALVYPNGRELHYDYGSTDEMDDAASRVASLIDDDGTTHLVNYSYLGMGSVVEQESPQPDLLYTLVSLTSSNDPDTGDIYAGLDRFGRVKDNRWYNYDALTDVDRIQYGYNRAGNRIWRKNVVADALGKHFDELYGNDAIQRLKDLQRGTLNGSQTGLTDETYAECWSLDQTGNWQKYLQDDDGSGWDLNQSRTANTVNEITDISASTGPTWVTPAYSKAGNMTTMPQPADPTASFTATYDAWNRLVKLVDDTTTHTIATYQYDGAKRRVVEQDYTTGTLEETRHCYFTEPSRWQVIEERLESSTEAEKQFVWGLRYIDDILLRDRDTNNGTLDERLYGLQDANWNVTCLIDSNGAAQERFAYSAYGQPVFLDASFAPQTSSSSDWETLYAGYRWESSSGLYNVRDRVYHPFAGNWAQRDPRGYLSGINMYAYSGGSPYNAIDPSGELFVVLIAVAIVGGILLAPTPAGAPAQNDYVPTGDPASTFPNICCAILGVFAIPRLIGSVTFSSTGSVTLPAASIKEGTKVIVVGGMAYTCTQVSGHGSPCNALCIHHVKNCSSTSMADLPDFPSNHGTWNIGRCDACFRRCIANCSAKTKGFDMNWPWPSRNYGDNLVKYTRCDYWNWN